MQFFYTQLRASGWSQVDLLKMVGFFLRYKTGNEILCISVLFSLFAVIIFFFPWLVFIIPAIKIIIKKTVVKQIAFQSFREKRLFPRNFIDFLYFSFQKHFKRNLNLLYFFICFKLIFIWVFLNYFDVVMLKIIFFKKILF